MDVLQSSDALLNAIDRDDKIKVKIGERNAAQMRTAKPCRYCIATCVMDEADCENCQACQKFFDEKLAEFEQFERRYQAAKNAPQTPQAVPAPTKCTLCGAPIQSGLSACPFCQTEYPSAPVFSGSVMERTEALYRELDFMIKYMALTKGVTYQAMTAGYMDLYTQLTTMSIEAISKEKNILLQSFMMTPQELMDDADARGMSYTDYMYRLMMEGIHSQKYQKLKGIDEKNREIQREADDKIHQIRMNELQRQGDLYVKKVPQYNGGSGGGGGDHCCGTCALYIPERARCALNPDSNYQKNATDYCGSYRLR